MEDYRIALVGIVVENADATEYLNLILHEYSAYIVGRMGIPYHDRGISIISVVMDAPQNIISALAGKLGQLHGVNVKTITQKAGTL
ncbi:MAG: iron-only hydrogenase system regulator [Clostridiaceae bacterium]|nr:iron-only hydrogenase system regulator [Clostridiaceae bacterium]